jgi:glutaminase
VTVTIQSALDAAVAEARSNSDGAPADYIPELARVDLERTSATVLTVSGELCSAGDAALGWYFALPIH